jgi:ABC-type hemin transport system ATPase subunit
MNINSIRDRAQGVDDGPVSEQEVEFARQILRSGDDDVGAVLFVVGPCGAHRDATLIAPYLCSEHKDVHGELALKGTRLNLLPTESSRRVPTVRAIRGKLRSGFNSE